MTDQRPEQDNIHPEQRRIVNASLLEGVEGAYVELINLSLQKGADINTRNADGRTPLMMAVWKDNASLVRFVLQKNPDLFLKDHSGETAYDLIRKVNNAETRKTITLIMLQALPDAPPLRDPTTDEVIALSEQEAAKPKAARAPVSAPKTATFGGKAVAKPKPKTGFSI